MAILKIARMGHPILGRRADSVADPGHPSIQRLAADMLETVCDADGAGLAAPQVHVSMRMVLFRVPAGAGGELAVPWTVLINPEIEPLDDCQAVGYEGCLSLPDLTGAVPRWTHIRYRGIGLDGSRIDREAHGFHARVVQHECDHLDGILYPVRMRDLSTFGFAKEIQRAMMEEDTGDGA